MQDSSLELTTTDVPNNDENSVVVITNVVNFTLLNIDDGSQIN
jgi:hypothetical protein